MADTNKNPLFDAFKLTSVEMQPVNKEKPVTTTATTETEEDKLKNDKGVTDVSAEDEKARLLAEEEKSKVVEGSTETAQTTEEVTDVNKEGSFVPFIEFLTNKNILTTSDKKYEDTEEGFAEAIKDTAKAEVNSLIEALPEDAKRLVQMAKEGVDIKQVFALEEQIVDFKAIDLTNEDNLYNMIIDHLISGGYEEAEAIETADGYKDAGIKTLEKHGKIAHKSLLKKQEDQVTLKIENDKAKLKATEAAKTKEFEAFKKEVLSTEKIGSFELSEKERKELLDYMTKPIKDGKTQSQIEDTKENRLLLAYLRMKKFDMTKIEKKVETKQATQLKEALGRFVDTNAKQTVTKQSPRQEPVGKLVLPDKLPWM